jgi:hypothetical protein
MVYGVIAIVFQILKQAAMIKMFKRIVNKSKKLKCNCIWHGA